MQNNVQYVEIEGKIQFEKYPYCDYDNKIIGQNNTTSLRLFK